LPRSLTTLAAFLLLTLGACGFQPVYGTRSPGNANSSVTSDLAAIKIAPIADRAGQLLRNSLQDKLTPRGVPARARYRLDVRLTENRSDLVILKDSTSTFSKVRFVADFTLVDLTNGQPVNRGQAESTTTFNRVDSDFAILAAEKDARRRAADEIGEDIRLRLGLYFNRIRGS
tara:strand:- start:213 stop:731 length:519 start_codon:yes stop_codon:yes gene_type:complete